MQRLVCASYHAGRRSCWILASLPIELVKSWKQDSLLDYLDRPWKRTIGQRLRGGMIILRVEVAAVAAVDIVVRNKPSTRANRSLRCKTAATSKGVATGVTLSKLVFIHEGLHQFVAIFIQEFSITGQVPNALHLWNALGKALSCDMPRIFRTWRVWFVSKALSKRAYLSALVLQPTRRSSFRAQGRCHHFAD